MKDAEARWLACTEPNEMLRDDDRKLRLFAVACCRRLGVLSQAARNAVETAERFADGLCEREELEDVRRAVPFRPHAREESARANSIAMYAALPRARAAAYAVCEAGFFLDEGAGRARQCDLLRDIFGNPYRPATIEPAWRAGNEGTVVKLARAIYEEGKFADLPVLGDALEDAGCRDEAILEHCREGGDHVRGCWVLDLVRATNV